MGHTPDTRYAYMRCYTDGGVVGDGENVFHFRFFNSTIYKESNVFDYKISDYKNESEINDESKKIEMELIDIEHDLWIKSTEIN